MVWVLRLFGLNELSAIFVIKFDHSGKEIVISAVTTTERGVVEIIRLCNAP
jgi:hypothetical protein